MVAALLVSTGGGLCLGSVVVARHQAQAAADLAALAGAVRLPAGAAAACSQAVLVAHQMTARHVECRVDGLDVVVNTELPGLFTARGIGPARASARAGPTGNRR